MRFKFVIFLMCVAWIVRAEPLDKVVAIVNEQVITQSELDEQTALIRQQIMAKQSAMPSDQILQKQVLQHLIEVDLQLQMAKNHDIVVDAQELDETIAGIAERNHLTLTQLREILEKQGMPFDAYRDNMRKEMVMHRLQQKAVSKDIVVSNQQVEDFLKTAALTQKINQLYHVQNILIPLSEAPTSTQVQKAFMKAQALLIKIKQGSDFSSLASTESNSEYLLESGDLGERHLAELPSMFAEHLATMSTGDVSPPIRTGNGVQLIKLLALNEQTERHEVVKMHVRHILLKPDANMTVDSATRQANNLYEQLKSGKDFAAMAKNYSADAASAVKGGDLGWVVADEVVPEFAHAMASLPLHTISHPVKSVFGWHLIEVLERKTIDDSYAYQRQQVRHQLEERKLSEAVQNWKQHIRSDAYIQIMDKKLA